MMTMPLSQAAEVLNADRLGAHIGTVLNAAVYRIPCAASRSIWGVFVSGCPARQPTQSFRSSMAIKSTFGRLPEPAPAARSAR